MLILNSTSFAYAKNRADAIVKKSQLFNDLKNIFFKYNDSYFYAKKLDPVKKEFYDIYLYKVSNKKVLEILKFKKAYFSNEKWIAKDGIKRELIYKGDIPSRYIDKKVASIEILKGYKPKVIKLLYEGKRVSLVDGFRVVSLIKSKDIDISKIKASLIQKIFIPFFALAAIIIIFYKIKFVKRELKKGLAILTIILGVLVGWALLFAITLLSENGVINGLYAIPAIILLMLLVAFIVKKSSFNTI
jgi:lipopolysaccharide export system permease protein